MRPNPKGLWHDHIDGCIAVTHIIEDLYRMARKPFPFPSTDAFRANAADRSKSIPDRFWPTLCVLQTSDALEYLGYEYGKHRAGEGYSYVEGKFAPQYHLTEGLTLRSACDALRKGLTRAEKEFDITIFPHICIGREAEPAVGEAIARVVLEYDGEAALDLACDEARYPPERHLPAYQMTFGTNVKRDCHAGEFVTGHRSDSSFKPRLLRNVLTAVFELRCHGIGHGIPIMDYDYLVEYMAGEGVRIAGCPLSNLDEGHIEHIHELGINELLDAGVLYTLNPDDDLFLPDMQQVLDVCGRLYEFTDEQAKALEANVFDGAFDERIRKP